VIDSTGVDLRRHQKGTGELILHRFKQWLLAVKARVPPRPLFLKFFICFIVMAWCSIHAIQLRTYLMGPQVVAPPDMYAVVAPILASEAVRVYEFGGPEAFAKFSRIQEESQKRQLYLLDGFNRDVLSRPVSADAMQAANSAKSGQLVVSRGSIAVYKYISATGRPYILMLYMRPGFGDLREVATGSKEASFRMSILLAVTLSCAWLAYQISSPVRRIQIAARRVAQGDLATRVPKSVLKRGDELAALGRDFDLMVNRLDVLVRNQKNLLDSVSHELRSPLTRINLTLSILKKRSMGRETDLTDQLERDIERVDVLIGQLLTLSRLENRMSSGEQEDVDLVQLLEEVVADGNFEGQAVDKKVCLTFTWSPVLRGGNSLALRSAFENVVRNGIRFTPPGTKVQVSLHADENASGQFARISIADSGHGMPEEFLNQVFQPFFRVPGTEKSGPGNGLGLAIAYEAIRVHGGIISARNVRPEGLEIVVVLPVVSESQTSRAIAFHELAI
jgi:signal transduction histidine kinase